MALSRHVWSKEQREKESLRLGDYMISTNETILSMEKSLGIPKTTIHRRLTITLKEVNYELWKECKRIMGQHKKDAAKIAHSTPRKSRK